MDEASAQRTETAAERIGGARVAALVACAVLAAAWVLPVSLERSWGYDESMHAQLPALRMLYSARAGDFGQAWDVLLGCNRYPFGYPVALAAAQAVFGTSELVGRALGRAIWVLGCFAIFLLAQDVVARLGRCDPRAAGADGRPRGAALAPWLALGLAAASPMTLMYAGTLFLEVPFAVAAVCTLRSLLRWDEDGGGARRHALALGAWVALCFFIKFNYGLLLVAGVGLELACRTAAAVHAGRTGAVLRLLAWTVAVPALAAAWWFLWPLPAGAATAAVHREAFLAYLTENTDASMRVGWDYRFKDWSVYLVYSPLVLVAVVVGLVANCDRLARPGVRPLVFFALALLVPPAFHSFHVDRFLIPGAVALWVLAGLGLARLLPRGAVARAVVGAVSLAAIALTAAPLAELAMDWVGLMPAEGRARDYARQVLAEHRSLNGARPLVTVGLWREDAEALSDCIAAGTGPDERIGWLGISSGYSRAALHAGLLARGAPVARFLRDAEREMFVETALADPGLDAAALEQWAAGFDVILYTAPVDLLDHHGRRFMQTYVDLLHAGGKWGCESIGSVAVADALRDARVVEVFACRRVPPR